MHSCQSVLYTVICRQTLVQRIQKSLSLSCSTQSSPARAHTQTYLAQHTCPTRACSLLSPLESHPPLTSRHPDSTPDLRGADGTRNGDQADHRIARAPVPTMQSAPSAWFPHVREGTTPSCSVEDNARGAFCNYTHSWS